MGPGDVAFVGRGALAVVAAEEGVARVDDVFAVNPVVVVAAAGLVEAEIDKVDVAAIGSQSRRGYRGLVSEEVIAPFGT